MCAELELRLLDARHVHPPNYSDHSLDNQPWPDWNAEIAKPIF